LLLGICTTNSNAIEPLGPCEEVPGNGLTPSSPSPAGGRYLFVLGTDRRVYINPHTGSGAVSGFTGWFPVLDLPDNLMALSEPGTIVNDLVTFFVRVSDNRIFQSDFDGLAFDEWTEVPGGGLTLSGPAAIVFSSFSVPIEPPSGLRLYVRGTDNGIYENVLP